MDCEDQDAILQLIPHRPPFLWVDRIISRSGQAIATETTIRADLELLAGHYPGNPIVPGVILCEAAFQAGALLIASLLAEENNPPQGVPVLTRITGARFKRPVRPGDTFQTEVQLDETVGGAWFLSARVKVAGRLAVQVSFACTLASMDHTA